MMENTERFTHGEYEYALLEEGVAEITKYTGYDENVRIPAEIDGHAVTEIGWSAFAGRSSLRSVVLPNSVTSIGGWAFYGCSSLTEIALPNGLKDIDDNPFTECNHLTKIIVSPDHPMLKMVNGMLINKKDKAVVCYPAGSPQERCDVPMDVTSIGRWAFCGCSSLTSVVLPEGVTRVEQKAFWRCSSLTEIALPEGMTSIGAFTFFNCSSLTSVAIPASVIEIGYCAFRNCSDELTFTVILGSYAEQWCRENGMKYTCVG